MPTPVSIFLDFNLPNATTWLYFSFLLAIALFFKFSRLLSVRNLDVVMMFLLAPGLLVVQSARPQPMPLEQQPAVQLAALVGQQAMPTGPVALTSDVARFAQQCGPTLERGSWLWFGYLWILLGSVYFFCRCLLDLTLVQRPALAPSLQTGGLAWLAGALLICLLAVAYRQVERQFHPLPVNGGSGAEILLSDKAPVEFAVTVLWRGWPAWAVAALAFAGHIVVVVELVLVAWRHFQDVAAGMAAATFYLMLPYTGFYVGQAPHVLPMALFLGTILLYRRPTLCGAMLGIAGAATYFPLFTLPIWVSFYRQRGVGRFLAACILTLAAGLGYLAFTLWLRDELVDSLKLALETTAWQPWLPPGDAEGFWAKTVPWAYRIPIFILFLSFVLTTTIWPAPKNLAHVIALSAGIFISLQWWGADQGGVHVLWYVPLLLLMVFRPNLHDRVASLIVPETDWLSLSIGWCVRIVRRVLNRPQQPVQRTAA
jgi:hypothetical protein